MNDNYQKEIKLVGETTPRIVLYGGNGGGMSLTALSNNMNLNREAKKQLEHNELPYGIRNRAERRRAGQRKNER